MRRSIVLMVLIAVLAAACGTAEEVAAPETTLMLHLTRTALPFGPPWIEQTPCISLGAYSQHSVGENRRGSSWHVSLLKRHRSCFWTSQRPHWM